MGHQRSKVSFPWFIMQDLLHSCSYAYSICMADTTMLTFMNYIIMWSQLHITCRIMNIALTTDIIL